MNYTDIHSALNRFEQLLKDLPVQFGKITGENFYLQPAPGKWSKKQIVGHLIDSAANNHQRFIRAQYEHIPTIVYDQNHWNILNMYETTDRDILINLLLHYNLHLVWVMKQIPPENLLLKCDTGNREPATLAFLITDYIAHFEHHLTQIVFL
jgi:hypothetical protein